MHTQSPHPAEATSPAEAHHFVERQVRFQLGLWADALGPLPHPRAADFRGRAARAGLSNMFTLFDAASGEVLLTRSPQELALAQQPDWFHHGKPLSLRKQRRLVEWMDSLRECGGQGVYALDPQDARRGPDETGVAATSLPAVPVFQFNRRPWRREAILWPLPRYHAFDHPGFLGLDAPDERPWRDKRPQAVWRGTLSGSVLREGERVNTMDRLTALAREGADDASVLRALAEVSRFRVLWQCRRSEVVDAGLVHNTPHEGLDGLAVLQPLRKPALTRAQMQEYRYLICLEGYDYASALYWSLNSNSVVLRQTYAWETFADAHFEPWVHYVPIAPERTDLEAKVAWCEAHPAVCERIIANARRQCALLAQPALREQALRAVVTHYESLLTPD